jgi:SAM-dependent methyltransferase
VEEESWAIAWEAGCARDPVRNQLIVPYLNQAFAAHKPKRVADLGCGTAYVPRQLIALNPDAPLSWFLVDRRADALDFAQRRWPAESKANFICGDLEDGDLQLGDIDFSIVAFTLMEIAITPIVAKTFVRTLSQSGHIVIIVPDTIRDLLELDASDAKEALEELERGMFMARKVDKFTGSPYPFFVQRHENIIAEMLRAGSRLIAMDRLSLPDGKAIFMLMFERAR